MIVIQWEDGKELLFDSFQLKWIHSVEKEEWIELYEREGDELVLKKTYFKTFGAGTPFDEKGTTVKDGYVVMDIDHTYDELLLTISENVKTTIVLMEKEIPLYKFIESYETATVSVHRLSVFTIMWEGLN